MLFQNREGMERENPLRSTVYRKGLFHLMNENINPGIISKPFFLALLHSIVKADPFLTAGLFKILSDNFVSVALTRQKVREIQKS